MGDVPCYSFQNAFWNVTFTSGNTNSNTIFNNPQYEMPCTLPITGCFLTESETNFAVYRIDYCYDLDGSRSQQVIYCYDEFVVTPPPCGKTKPPPCGKTKIVERNKLNCICGTI